jgi:hypothetical protein
MKQVLVGQMRITESPVLNAAAQKGTAYDYNIILLSFIRLKGFGR